MSTNKYKKCCQAQSLPLSAAIYKITQIGKREEENRSCQILCATGNKKNATMENTVMKILL